MEMKILIYFTYKNLKYFIKPISTYVYLLELNKLLVLITL